MQYIMTTYNATPEVRSTGNGGVVLLIKETSLKLFRIFNGLLGYGYVYHLLHVGHIMKGKAL